MTPSVLPAGGWHVLGTTAARQEGGGSFAQVTLPARKSGKHVYDGQAHEVPDPAPGMQTRRTPLIVKQLAQKARDGVHVLLRYSCSR